MLLTGSLVAAIQNRKEKKGYLWQYADQDDVSHDAANGSGGGAGGGRQMRLREGGEGERYGVSPRSRCQLVGGWRTAAEALITYYLLVITYHLLLIAHRLAQQNVQLSKP